MEAEALVSHKGYRFPAEVISHAVWLYHRFPLSYREVEELLFERGVTVTYESIRAWCATFGPAYARQLRRRQPRPGDKWYRRGPEIPRRLLQELLALPPTTTSDHSK